MNLFIIKNEELNYKNVLSEKEENQLKTIISRYLLQKKISWAMIIIGGILSLYLIGIPFLIYGIYMLIKLKESIKINFCLPNDHMEEFNEFVSNLETINKCSKRWEIMGSNVVDKSRIHAGANNLVDRKELGASKEKDYFIISNEKYLVIKINNGQIIFLPNIIIYIRKSKIKFGYYNEFKIKPSITNFRENGIVPKDAYVVDYTWQYVNNNGTRDKRYKDNKKIPICKYMIYTLSFCDNDITLMLSNVI